VIFMSKSVMPVRGAATTAAAAVALAIIAGCASAPPPATPVLLDFPTPVGGPGLPDLGRGDEDAIARGWKALQKGDAATARAVAANSGDSPAAALLSMQAALVAGTEIPMSGLERLTTTHSDYAAAWLTLSVAAERADDEKAALEAATRGAELWPDKRWRRREQDLRQRWIGDRIGSARELYETENPAAALEALEPALAVEPDNREGVILKARSLIELDEPDRAEAVLSVLPRDPEVVRVAGNIAEARGDLSAAMRIYRSLPDDPEATLRAVAIAESQGDWTTAMNLYESLPDDLPEKGPGLRRAKLRWRVSVMPGYVQEAIRSPELDRAQLAVVVVTLAPRVETLPGGQVPLLSDIMTLPAQNEILTAARFGLIESDRILHRFNPERPVTGTEVRHAVDRLARLLDLDGPRWCSDELEDQTCTELAAPISGEEVASVVIDIVAQEDGDE
jgi:tetratricopeptide (TPR) repeat protein